MSGVRQVLRDDVGGVTCRPWKGFGFSFTCSGNPVESFNQGSHTTWFSVKKYLI